MAEGLIPRFNWEAGDERTWPGTWRTVSEEQERRRNLNDWWHSLYVRVPPKKDDNPMVTKPVSKGRRYATARQIAFLCLLAYENCDVTDEAKLVMHAAHFAEMTSAEASELISEWQKLPTINKAPKLLQEALENARMASTP